MHGELIREDGEEGSVISSWLLPLLQAVHAGCHEPRFDVISTSYCLLFYLETLPEGHSALPGPYCEELQLTALKGASTAILYWMFRALNLMSSICLSIIRQSSINDLSILCYLFVYFGLL